MLRNNCLKFESVSGKALLFNPSAKKVNVIMGACCRLLKKVFTPIPLPQGRWFTLYHLQVAYFGYLGSRPDWSRNVTEALYIAPYAINYTHGKREVGELLLEGELHCSRTPLIEHIRLFSTYPDECRLYLRSSHHTSLYPMLRCFTGGRMHV